MDTPTSPSSAPQTAAEHDEHVRTRLLNAAVRIFDRKGYAAASVREVAQSAGVTKPALYYHFGSKQGLLVAILEQAKRDFDGAIERALSRRGTARDRILAMCEDVYGLFGQNVPVARVAHAVFLGPPDTAPPFDVTVFEARFRSAIEAIVADGVVAREFKEVAPSDVALAVMGVLEGCTERQMQPAFEPVGADGLRRLINLLFDGVRSTPRAKGEDKP